MEFGDADKRIWRILPVEAYKNFLKDNELLDKSFIFYNGRPLHVISPPNTDFEKKVFNQLENLLTSHVKNETEYIVPLVKEFVIDNNNYQAAILFRHQNDFSLNNGYKINESIFYVDSTDKLKKVYEIDKWTGWHPFNYSFSKIAKFDPLLRGLQEIEAVIENPEIYNLNLDKEKISFMERTSWFESWKEKSILIPNESKK